MKCNSLFWIISIQFFCLLLENVKTYYLCQSKQTCQTYYLCNKMPYCGWLKQDIYFLAVLEAKGLRSRSLLIRFLLRALLLVCPLSCVLLWQNKSSSSSKVQTHPDEGSTLMTSFNLNYLLTGPISRYITLGQIRPGILILENVKVFFIIMKKNISSVINTCQALWEVPYKYLWI